MVARQNPRGKQTSETSRKLRGGAPPQRSELSYSALSRLAETVKLTPDAVMDDEGDPSFGTALAEFFSWAAREHAIHEGIVTRWREIERQLTPFEEAVAVALLRLRALNSEARSALDLYHTRQAQFGSVEDDLKRQEQLEDLLDEDVDWWPPDVGRAVASNIEASLQDILTAVCNRPWRNPSHRPRKNALVLGNPRIPYFDIFIPKLSYLVHSFGGRLSVDKNVGCGRAINFLREAAAYLPANLVPSWIMDSEEHCDNAGWARLAKLIARGRSRKKFHLRMDLMTSAV